MTQRTRVGIVFGGTSSEHDVSCLTAGGVSRAIDPERFEVIGVGITPPSTSATTPSCGLSIGMNHCGVQRKITRFFDRQLCG